MERTDGIFRGFLLCFVLAGLLAACDDVGRDADGLLAACGDDAGMDAEIVDAGPPPCVPEPEICNDLDDDCDGATDEDAAATSYADCDGDTWATESAITFVGCVQPPVSDTGCATAAQAWTTRVPTFTDFDCADNDPRGRSGTTTFYTTPIPDAFPEGDFDFNCDFSEELEVPLNGSCMLVGSTCTATMGWAAGPIPLCGEASLAITGCTAGCEPTTETRTQGCR